MDILRWIVLGGGVLVILAVYLFSRRGSAERDDGFRREPMPGGLLADADEPESPTGGRIEPRLQMAESAADAEEPPGQGEPVPTSRHTVGERKADQPIELIDDYEDDLVEHESTRDPIPQKIISLQLMGRDGGRLAGSMVRSALNAEGLEYGTYNIFHRQHRDEKGIESVFSVANLVEPGSFDLDMLPTSELNGLSMFMVLPGPRPGVEAFADMLATGRRLATQLEAELTDQHGSTMSRQTADHLRDSIIDYELKVTRAHDDIADDII